MCPYHDEKSGLSRRNFLTKSAGLAAAVGTGLSAQAAPDTKGQKVTQTEASEQSSRHLTEPFWGRHQSGIITPVQSHTYIAALDLVATSREDVIQLLRKWTSTAARLASGQPAEPVANETDAPAGDSADALELPSARLTLTFSFGPGLFTKEGKDRYGLAAR